MPSIILILLCAIFAAELRAQNAQPTPGLRLTLRAGEVIDTRPAPNITLYVAEGQSASPLLPAGPFTAQWEGFAAADLRGDYVFHAIGHGGVKLEVNNVPVLDVPAITAAATTKTVRLNKGANALKVIYTSPAKGDAQLRLLWNPRPDKPMPHEPIRSALLSHAPVAAPTPLIHQGRELFFESRCAKCHQPSKTAASTPDLERDAPNLAGIGNRRHTQWMAQWILNPKAQRPSARMPALLHGATAQADAEAIAAYLGSLKDPKSSPPKPSPGDATAGKELAEKLHCAGCHNVPGEAPLEAGKISLAHIRQKFLAAELPQFLLAPNAHYAWTHMPTFRLTAEETGQLAAWLSAGLPAPAPAPAAPAKEILARGKQLLTTTGCLNCHGAPDENKFPARALTALAADKWTHGCLADVPPADSKAPRYAFTPEERAALRALAPAAAAVVTRHDPIEFAERQARQLNCAACHGKLEGVPLLESVGTKLKPEWMQSLLSGAHKQPARPWLAHRMPAFPAYATHVAHGLAMSHGLPPKSRALPVIDPKLAELGRKLVGVEGGFSCVACHGVKNVPPLQVFEAQGINFSLSGARIQPDYYVRWMLDPLRVDPQTRMPDYFDEDARSVLVDMLEGDALKQIDAVLHYLLQGDKMALPVMQ